jgi:SAM-dependent methyltransferase
MSNKVFEKGYAEQYDLLYGDKNYESECDTLEYLFQKYSSKKIQTILDLGCGTGNHSIPLALRGYSVTGVDVSEAMVNQARQKLTETNLGANDLEPVFIKSDLLDLQVNQRFDVVLMMFAVLGYQLDNVQIANALKIVNDHLNPGGLFIFDVWYGPAVLKIRPSDRIKIIPLKNGYVLRAASGKLNIFQQLAQVNYHIWQISDGCVVKETEEIHKMRYFFPQELDYFITQSGMEMTCLTAFPTIDQPASEDIWNALCVAKK